jgi:hypothetical protein
MRNKRIDKLEAELASLESEFRERLIRALRLCADGYWGLFGQNDHVSSPRLQDELATASGSRELMELGAAIDALRQRIGINGTYALFSRFLELRGRSHANALGEARLAQAWLEELGEPIHPRDQK